MTIMRALWKCAEDVRQAGCRVAILQPDPTVTAEAHVLRSATGLDIEILPRLPYEGLMHLMGSARVVMAMTVNDGLPSILVEAMAFGALPLHSDLEPIREWIEDGKNGLLVGAEDVEATAEAIRRAVRDDGLVDRAAEINGRLVAEKLEYGAVRQRAIEMYERVVSGELSQ
jgi:glycosyltransferase involved in cell wall biosynthesis